MVNEWSRNRTIEKHPEGSRSVIMKLKKSPKEANRGSINFKGMETLGKKEGAHHLGILAGWGQYQRGRGRGCQFRPHFENACRGRKHIPNPKRYLIPLLGKFPIPQISHIVAIILFPSVDDGLGQRVLKFLVNLVPRIMMDNCCGITYLPLFLSLSFSLWNWQSLGTNQSPPSLIT